MATGDTKLGDGQEQTVVSQPFFTSLCSILFVPASAEFLVNISSPLVPSRPVGRFPVVVAADTVGRFGRIVVAAGTLLDNADLVDGVVDVHHGACHLSVEASLLVLLED